MIKNVPELIRDFQKNMEPLKGIDVALRFFDNEGNPCFILEKPGREKPYILSDFETMEKVEVSSMEGARVNSCCIGVIAAEIFQANEYYSAFEAIPYIQDRTLEMFRELEIVKKWLSNYPEIGSYKTTKKETK